MDILVESFSRDNSTGRTRAIYFTASNIAWIIAQLVSGQMANLEGYRVSFLISALIIIPFLIIFASSAKRLKDTMPYKKIRPLSTIKKVLTNNNIRGIFGLAFLLNLFYSCVVIFIPVYLHQVLGFGWDKLSIMFAIMLIPFVIFEIPAGILADKYIGEKEIFYTGFFILILSLLFFAFNRAHSFWAWTAILFFSRIGAALVESMREAYFFKIVEAKDVQLINFFRTTGPLGYIAGALIATIFLTTHSLNYVFIILAMIMASSFLFLTSMKDTK
jgi:MFS family permease